MSLLIIAERRLASVALDNPASRLAHKLERQCQFLILPLKQFIDRVLYWVIRYDARAGGLVIAHRHIISHERYIRLQLGVGQNKELPRARGVAIVTAAGLLADERRPFSRMYVRQELRSGGKRVTVDQDVNLAGEGWSARLLNAPVGVLYHSVFAVWLSFEHVGRQGALLGRVFAKAEIQRVEDQVVVILERLVDQERQQELAEIVGPTAVIAQIKDERSALLLGDLGERFPEKYAQVLVVRGAAEAIDFQISDLAVVEKRKRSGVFRALLLELGGINAVQTDGGFASLCGVPIGDSVGALQTEQIDEVVGKVGADAPHPRGLHVTVAGRGSEHQLNDLIGRHTVDRANLFARQRAL